MFTFGVDGWPRTVATSSTATTAVSVKRMRAIIDASGCGYARRRYAQERPATAAPER
jgi:hypothetical protein